MLSYHEPVIYLILRWSCKHARPERRLLRWLEDRGREHKASLGGIHRKILAGRLVGGEISDEKGMAVTTQLTSAEPAQLEQVSDKGGRGKEGGIARASRMLGLDRSEVIRSIKISKLPVEVKQAVVDAGLADNQAAMLRIAAEQSLDAQFTAVRSERERAEAPRKSKADRDVARESAASLAAFILQRTDPRVRRKGSGGSVAGKLHPESGDRRNAKAGAGILPVTKLHLPAATAPFSRLIMQGSQEPTGDQRSSDH
jgi:hypothetical protein